ncbi:MAG: hypothetical protein MJ249_13765 [Kiritimatiellae bacterium]|nr:hypothetical protein [Kiritimatiellia bacterium]
MKIYVDMDDVLCETAANLCRLAERAFGKHVPYEKVFQFDLQEVFGLTDDEMKRFMVLSHDFDSLLTHPVTPGAPEALRTLREQGHDVQIITGRPASAHAPTEAWLTRYGLGDFPVTYVDKYGRDACYAHNPDDPPTVTLRELLARSYDLAIDDSPNVLTHLAAWQATRIFVFNRPWNQSFTLAPNMTRVQSWQDILARI